MTERNPVIAYATLEMGMGVELLLEIFLVTQAPHLEKEFYEAHEILAGPFLSPLLRPTALTPPTCSSTG